MPGSRIPHRAIMSLGRHARFTRKCVSFTSESNGGVVKGPNERSSEKIPVSFMTLAKMSMNQWKIVSQLKELINKYNNEKNVQIVLNKDWVNFFQKLTYSQIEAIRKYSYNQNGADKPGNNHQVIEPERKTESEIIDRTTPKQQVTERATVIKSVELKDHLYWMQQAISSFMPKMTKGKVMASSTITPKWKSNIQGSISAETIVSRTKYILSSIETAESSISKLRRIDDLLLHLDQYSEARYHAIKKGAKAILLNVKRKTTNPDVRDAAKEALAVLGHVDPLPGQGIRILAIDGGGIRGLLVLELLKKLEQLSGKPVYEMFDYICGVSTGAILSSALGGYRTKSLDEISNLYKELSTKVFSQSTLRGTSNLVWSQAYYDTELWQNLLKTYLGDTELIKTVRVPGAPKFSAVSAIVNQHTVMAYVFRNYTFPPGMSSQYLGSHKHKLWEIARASSAAPTFFEEYKCGEYLHQDGGIMVNNPCAIAIHEAKQIWPDSEIQCVVSCGTGRAPHSVKETTPVEPGASSWKDKFYRILDSATDTEGVHTTLNDLLPDNIYFRFNPYLTEMLTMSEIRPEKLLQLEQDAHMYIRRNEEKFQAAAEALVKKRKFLQKVNDWFTLNKQLLFRS